MGLRRQHDTTTRRRYLAPLSILEVKYMNTRLKEIVDNLNKMKIDLDGTFRFHCTMCGKCCIHQEDILLSPRDIYRMSKELAITPEELFDQYCETYIGSDSRIPIVRLVPRGFIRRCPFLKDQKCMVHRSKPAVCAMFPIGRCLRIDSENETLEDMTTSRIEYILTDPGCGDNLETHTVREWLHDFNISEEDEFFLKWHQAIGGLGKIFRKMEKTASAQDMDLAWTATFVRLYLHYDMEREFMPQFEENVQEIFMLMQMGLSDEGEEANE